MATVCDLNSYKLFLYERYGKSLLLRIWLTKEIHILFKNKSKTDYYSGFLWTQTSGTSTQSYSSAIYNVFIKRKTIIVKWLTVCVVYVRLFRRMAYYHSVELSGVV